MIFNSCDQVQMKLTHLELTTTRLATTAECVGKQKNVKYRKSGNFCGRNIFVRKAMHKNLNACTLFMLACMVRGCSNKDVST